MPPPKYRIHGGSFLTTRGAQRMRGAHGFGGPSDMLSEDLGFRTFLRVRELRT